MSFLATQLIGFGAGESGFTGYSTEYTTAGTQTVSLPAGATAVTIECIGAGSGPHLIGKGPYGGGGGAYSKTNSYSLSGLTGIYISVPDTADYNVNGSDSFAKQNSSGGTTICLAKGGASRIGGSSASGTGDVKYSGGNAADNNQGAFGGGGAGGPSGSGSNSSSATGGASGGSPGGAGGNYQSNGQNYGGGAGIGIGPTGAQGYVKLTWA